MRGGDFAGALCALAIDFRRAVCGRRVISATGIRRELLDAVDGARRQSDSAMRAQRRGCGR